MNLGASDPAHGVVKHRQLAPAREMPRPQRVAWWLALALLGIPGCAMMQESLQVDDPPRFEFRRADTGKAPAIALVLSGGSARGFAHIGVIKVLEESGLAPDLIVGVSAGSLVGAAYAAGMSAREMVEVANRMDSTMLADFTLPNLGQPMLRGELGFVRGERLQTVVNQWVANQPLENLPRRLAVVATDLQSGKPVVFTHGNTGLAVRASAAVPGVFVPPSIQGRLYVDGQVSSPVPVAIARMLGGHIVIAVDATFPPDHAEIANIASVLFQSFTIATQRIKDYELGTASLVIRPDIKASGQLGFEDRDWIIAAGERAARAAMPALLELMKGQPDAATRSGVILLPNK